MLNGSFAASCCAFHVRSADRPCSEALWPEERWCDRFSEIAHFSAAHAARRHPLLRYYLATGDERAMQISDVPARFAGPDIVAAWNELGRHWGGVQNQLALPLLMTPHAHRGFVIGRTDPFTQAGDAPRPHAAATAVRPRPAGRVGRPVVEAGRAGRRGRRRGSPAHAPRARRPDAARGRVDRRRDRTAVAHHRAHGSEASGALLREARGGPTASPRCSARSTWVSSPRPGHCAAEHLMRAQVGALIPTDDYVFDAMGVAAADRFTGTSRGCGIRAAPDQGGKSPS